MNNTNSLRQVIVDKIDIVNVISQYVKLEKKGNNYIGICPFHDDKNPSMSVSPQKKMFKCFSCGVGGDVVSFISKYKNISISEAMQELGKDLGINVTLSKKDLERQKNSKYYDILKEATSFYHFYLNNTSASKSALEYLSSRKIDQETIERFNIGLAGDGDVLYKTLSNKNILALDMINVGVVRGGDFYHDVFQNRIMFPIKDNEGSYVGFGGRIYLPNAKESKYLNTNETIIFKKGDILYNYFDASRDIKKENAVYLFEGYMDAIAAVRSGVLNSVASMGTSLTINQINAIKRLTNKIIICYDSDGPGTVATIKAITLIAKNKMMVDVVRIPNGKDADEFLFNNGKERLYECLKNNIISGIDFLYKFEKNNTDFSNINSVDNFKNAVFNHLYLFDSKTIQDKTIKSLSEELSLNYESLYDEFLKSRNNYNRQEIISIKEKTPIKDKKIDKSFEIVKNKYMISERRLIKKAYNNKKDCLEIFSRLDTCFYDSINRDVLYELYAYYLAHDKINNDLLYEKLNDNQISNLEDILENELLPDDSEIKVLIQNIKEWPYDKLINILANKEEKSEEDLAMMIEYKSKKIKIKKRSDK